MKRNAVRPWKEMQSTAVHVRLAWVEKAIIAWHNQASAMWQATKADLRAGCEWYLDQGSLRAVPYIGLCEAFLDESAQQE